MDERFKKAEDEYFRLKGQLAAGRITQDQFEAALKEMMIQDVPGRYWTIGADSGKWYVNDGAAWVEAQPPDSGASPIPPAAPPIAPTQSRGAGKILFVFAGVIGVLCLCGLGAIVFAFSQGLISGRTGPGTVSTNSSPPPSSAATCRSIQSFAEQGIEHVLPNQPHPAYNSNPPTSGWHWDTPKDWGTYTTPQVQEQLVHNLEHGGIVIQYKDLTATELQQLTDFVKRDPYHMILAPYPGLPSNVRVALTAWTLLQNCMGVDQNAIRSFVNENRDNGPEQVP